MWNVMWWALRGWGDEEFLPITGAYKLVSTLDTERKMCRFPQPRVPLLAGSSSASFSSNGTMCSLIAGNSACKRTRLCQTLFKALYQEQTTTNAHLAASTAKPAADQNGCF